MSSRDDADVRDRKVKRDLDTLRVWQEAAPRSLGFDFTDEVGHIEAYIESILAERDAAVRERDWLAEECAALDLWATMNSRIGYIQTGETAAWIAAAKEATS